MPDPISAIQPSSTAPPAGATTSRPDQLGKDTFLKLLVAQLKYQDPSKPADSQQFLAQSAQFSMVEKLEEIARQTTEALAAQRAGASSSYLGRTVKGVVDGRTVEGVVTGVRLDPAGPVLRVGSTDLPLGAVKEVTLTTHSSGTEAGDTGPTAPGTEA